MAGSVVTISTPASSAVSGVIRPGDVTTGVDYSGYLQGTNAYLQQFSAEKQAELNRASETSARIQRPYGMIVPAQEALARMQYGFGKQAQELSSAQTTGLKQIDTAEYQKALSEAPSRLTYLYNPDAYTNAVGNWISKYQDVISRPEHYEEVKSYVEGNAPATGDYATKINQAVQTLSQFKTYQGAGGDFGSRLFSQGPQYSPMYLQGAGLMQIPYFTGVYKEFLPDTGEIVTRQSNLQYITSRGNPVTTETELGRQKLVDSSDPFLSQYIGNVVASKGMFSYTPDQSEKIAAQQNQQLLANLATSTAQAKAATKIVAWDPSSSMFFQQTKGSPQLGIAPVVTGTFKPDAKGILKMTPYTQQNAQRIIGNTGYNANEIMGIASGAMSRGFNPAQIANAFVGGPSATLVNRQKIITAQNQSTFQDYVNQQLKSKMSMSNLLS